MTQGSRPLGTFSISTFVTVAPVPVRRTSSSGASAVTVIDSDTEGLSTIVTSLLRPCESEGSRSGPQSTFESARRESRSRIASVPRFIRESKRTRWRRS